MGKIFSKDKKKDKEKDKNQGVPSSGAGMNRISSQDQAILDVKARQRKIRTYMEKMEQ